MSTITKILNLMSEQEISYKAMAKNLNLNQQVITDWKNGKSKSYEKYLYQIAGCLNTSVEYLTGKTDKKEKPEGGIYSCEPLNDTTATNLYRSLTPEKKQKALEYLEYLKYLESKFKD